MILVSSCLAGIKCRYNGTDSLENTIQQLVNQKKATMVCPELLGGFSTPREPAEIIGGTGIDVLNGTAKVVEKSGKNVTDLYIKGAYQTLKMAKDLNATYIVLKEASPSCGSQMIYNGNFQNEKIPGEGVTSALLTNEGFKVISEKELAKLKLLS
ncbi:DUF523 domain-containing protein [Metabacillus arenae]|uniref:DUF523 domain-containing protein n=1 Tax=Metabacillus arenae TaxID=2771434 RepID=A0A926RXT9_9BACI|nr:DUF523 domain-containing protein [Metabacillus arenae]MBD1381035.1 DUF523 domain-containing protein [Metabacillus arenae]